MIPFLRLSTFLLELRKIQNCSTTLKSIGARLKTFLQQFHISGRHHRYVLTALLEHQGFISEFLQ